MKVTLASDQPLTDDACKAATGRTISEWFAELDAQPSLGRRDAINWLYDQTGRGKDTWWPTTIWVMHEASKGVVNKKDGLAEGYNICATKTVTSSAEAVYAAWTDPAQNGWLGCGPVAEGAPYTDDGGNAGAWLRLRPAKDLRLTWKTAGVPHATLVDVSFTEKGGKVGVLVNHARIQTREEADGLRSAWLAALDVLKKQLEG